VRQLSVPDAKAMAAIHAVAFVAPFGTGGWDALEMSAHVQKDLCLGIDHEGALAAFIIIYAAADQAEILTIATASTARRKGLGRQLLDAAAKSLRARDISELFLEVAEDNTSAIALYKSAGFEPIGRRPGYYRRPEGRVAALTFSKKI